MPDAYDIHEGRFIQERTYTSAANDLIVGSGTVPTGKVWTLLSASYYPSVSETQDVFFSVLSRASVDYPVTFPRNIALSTSIKEPLLTEGLEMKLFPGELLRGHRGAATAGSTITIEIRYIESDLPYYAYTEPQKSVTQKKVQRSQAIASGRISEAAPGPTAVDRGGKQGGGRSEPV